MIMYNVSYIVFKIGNIGKGEIRLDYLKMIRYRTNVYTIRKGLKFHIIRLYHTYSLRLVI